MRYVSRRFPFAPFTVLTTSDEGLSVEIWSSTQLWPWQRIQRLSLSREYRKNRPTRYVCTIHRDDGANVELIDDPWDDAQPSTPYTPFVKELHRQLGERPPGAVFRFDGHPFQSAFAILSVLALFFLFLPFGLGVGALMALVADTRWGLLFIGFPCFGWVPLVLLVALAVWQARPRTWTASDIPRDLLP